MQPLWIIRTAPGGHLAHGSLTGLGGVMSVAVIVKVIVPARAQLSSWTANRVSGWWAGIWVVGVLWAGPAVVAADPARAWA